MELVNSEVKKCSHCGSTNKVSYFNGYLFCGKHYSQMKKFGKVLNRTKYDKNDFVIHGEDVHIYLFDRHCNHCATAIVSIEDYDFVKKYKWCLSKTGYAITTVDNKVKYLHRFLLDVKDSKIYVDHINHNKLDNRRSNLRKCTNSENLMNRSNLPSNNKTGVVGVFWIKERNKWRAEISFLGNSKSKHLGYYENFDDAVQARRDAEEKYFKEFKSNYDYDKGKQHDTFKP